MHSERTLVNLLGPLYDAAGDPSLWPVFLDALGRTLHAPWCAFQLRNTRLQQCDAYAEVGFDPAFARSYEQYFAPKNLFLASAERLQEGEVATSGMLCEKEMLRTSEFYNDWMSPQRMDDGLNGTIFKNRRSVTVLNAIRPRHLHPFSREDVNLVRALLPHLQRAAHLHVQIAQVRALDRAMDVALDRWTTGVFLMDRAGRVLAMNRAAETIVRHGEGLVLVDGYLATRNPGDTTRLRGLVREASTSAHAPLRAPGGSMTVIGVDGRPLCAQILPLPSAGGVFPDVAGPAPACAVFVNTAAGVDSSTLRRRYGLTAAEARVAALLAQGKNANTVADALRVTVSTARTHIKALNRKFGVRRQAGLVARILLDEATAVQGDALYD